MRLTISITTTEAAQLIMKFLVLAVLASAGLCSAAKDQCGTGGIVTKLVHWVVDTGCYIQKDAINSCCVEHDDCYTKQKGRGACDKRFCGCLENAVTSVASGKDRATCSRTSTVMCEMVELLGSPAYTKAGAEEMLKKAKTWIKEHASASATEIKSKVSDWKKVIG
ncbi:hypothetical protein QR680_004165 [Steinernema hermaphroditum]|uniref:Phospholipase A2 n=1 Tax=Steinernema hermaphroditum TaxID=289476 RepID=A0AA39LTJ3_9BILA|nr:hypothetical protein QR680_004165 [Steinernema hermaphroditum]